MERAANASWQEYVKLSLPGIATKGVPQTLLACRHRELLGLSRLLPQQFFQQSSLLDKCQRWSLSLFHEALPC
jgi:hypothetical protein